MAARSTHTRPLPQPANGTRLPWRPTEKGLTLNQHRRRIDQVLDPDFVDDLESLSLDELRTRRGVCDGLDTELSYYRRLLHGRMDLLAFELERRAGRETRSLIEALPDILADGEPGGTHQVLLPRSLPVDPPDTPESGRRNIDRVLGDDFLAHLPEISDSDLEEIQATLTTTERQISDQRRSVYEVLELLTAEVARRYRDGLASVSELLPR